MHDDSEGTSRHPVLVVGGGPAGATFAALLAKEGVPVLLLERAVFPRYNIGESLQPATIGILEHHLGLGAAIASQGFARKFGAVYTWGKTREPWSVLFDERLEVDLPGLNESQLLAGGYELAWQVERARFDALILEEAVRVGVQVRQEVEVLEPVFGEEGRVVGVRVKTGDGGNEVIHADLVVDASGRGRLLGRALNLTEPIDGLNTAATWGYVEGAGGFPGPLGRHVQQVVTLDEGWAWFIPVSAERTSIGVVVEESRAVEEDEFEDMIRRANFPMDGARRFQYPRCPWLMSARGFAHCCSAFRGPGWLLLGDAAFFVDPVLSGGVDIAVRSAADAALALLTMLGDGDEPEVDPLADWEARLRREYAAYLRMVRYWYGHNRSMEGLFWEARAEIGAESISTPLRAFVYLTSGQYATDRHFRIYQRWQEQKMFRALGVDREGLGQALSRRLRKD